MRESLEWGLQFAPGDGRRSRSGSEARGSGVGLKVIETAVRGSGGGLGAAAVLGVRGEATGVQHRSQGECLEGVRESVGRVILRTPGIGTLRTVPEWCPGSGH